MTSYHYSTVRTEREAFIDEHIGEGTPVDSFIVDRGHPKGAEIHTVTDTAIILIYNQLTHKLITKLIARPEQIYRLYYTNNRKPPKKVLKMAYKHVTANYHKI